MKYKIISLLLNNRNPNSIGSFDLQLYDPDVLLTNCRLFISNKRFRISFLCYKPTIGVGKQRVIVTKEFYYRLVEDILSMLPKDFIESKSVDIVRLNHSLYID